jgi:hypothetical protein
MQLALPAIGAIAAGTPRTRSASIPTSPLRVQQIRGGRFVDGTSGGANGHERLGIETRRSRSPQSRVTGQDQVSLVDSVGASFRLLFVLETKQKAVGMQNDVVLARDHGCPTVVRRADRDAVLPRMPVLS